MSGASADHGGRLFLAGTPDNPDAAPSPSQLPAGTAREDIRILIVEDEAFARLDIEQALTAAGYQVVGTAVAAGEAVTKARQLKPDLVLMDIQLRPSPLGDGIDAAVEIRRQLSVPSLFISAFSDPATQARAAPAQPVGFLSKPIDSAQLVVALDQLFQAP